MAIPLPLLATHLCSISRIVAVCVLVQTHASISVALCCFRCIPLRAHATLSHATLSSLVSQAFKRNPDFVNGLGCTVDLADSSSGTLAPLNFCNIRREGSMTYIDLKNAFVYVGVSAVVLVYLRVAPLCRTDFVLSMVV